MEGFKWSCSGSTWDHVHHWGLNFCEVQVTEISSQVVDDLVSNLEDFLYMVVHDQVKITLAVSGIFV